jgi:hypothetical protein
VTEAPPGDVWSKRPARPICHRAGAPNVRWRIDSNTMQRTFPCAASRLLLQLRCQAPARCAHPVRFAAKRLKRRAECVPCRFRV